MKASNAARADFRTDINGLRAWAVVAVILYHFGVPGFGGGFVGVDVFFVISGFLMAQIIVKGLERGDFSLIGFYLARAKRIIPALAVLCAALLVLGWFLVLPPDYKNLGTHAVYSLSFLSNIEYWQEAGYFDLASHEKWLLHTWSLSVEWQFYMLLPIALLGAWRLLPGRSALRWVVGAGFILSYAAAVVVTPRDQSAAFYLLHTRAWEMLGGGLVFLFAMPTTVPAATRRWLERLGLLLIVVSIAIVDKNTAWPGWRALLPVAAAVLVVLAGQPSIFTGNKVAQWLGDRSYSLYLWHWPICVGLVYTETETRPLVVVAGILLTLMLGHLSFLLVESKLRYRLAKTRRLQAAGVLAVAMGVVATAGVAVWLQQGVNGRFSQPVERAAAEASNFNPRKAACHATKGAVSPSCVYGGPETKAVLVGDSHADAVVSALDQSRADAHSGLVQWTYSGCLYLPGMKNTAAFEASMNPGHDCTGFNSWVNARLNQLPAEIAVVIVGRYAGSGLGPDEKKLERDVPTVYFSKAYPVATPTFLKEFSNKMVANVCELAEKRTVYMMRPIPEMGMNVPKIMSRRIALGKVTDISISLADYWRRNGWVWAAQDAAHRACGVKILNPLPYLCRNGRCYGSQGGKPLYFDDDHLSETGNKLLVPMFGEVFKPRR